MVCLHVNRVGQDRVYTSYMTIYLVISLPKTLFRYEHRINIVIYLWFWPALSMKRTHVHGVMEGITSGHTMTLESYLSPLYDCDLVNSSHMSVTF